MNAAKAWTPARIAFIRARFDVRCYWCGFVIAKGSSCAYYADEHATAHDKCHREACT